jgi:hypothetical protein
MAAEREALAAMLAVANTARREEASVAEEAAHMTQEATTTTVA